MLLRKSEHALLDPLAVRRRIDGGQRAQTVAQHGLLLGDLAARIARAQVAAHGNHNELLERSELYREIVEKGMPDQVFLNRKPLEAEVAGL